MCESCNNLPQPLSLSSWFSIALNQQLEVDEKRPGTIIVKDQLGIHEAEEIKYLLK